MTEVGFYHLTRTGPERALPKLLGHTLAAHERALILCGSQERVDALDATLWLCGTPLWLPHGTAQTGNADLQPIWLSMRAGDAGAPPNHAHFLFLIDGVSVTRFDLFTRIFDLFDGSDDVALAGARERWNAARAAGCAVTYWQQGPRGWVRKEE